MNVMEIILYVTQKQTAYFVNHGYVIFVTKDINIKIYRYNIWKKKDQLADQDFTLQKKEDETKMIT